MTEKQKELYLTSDEARTLGRNLQLEFGTYAHSNLLQPNRERYCEL